MTTEHKPTSRPHEQRGLVEIRWASGGDPDDVVAPWPHVNQRVAATSNPAVSPQTADECSDCGHEHVNGRSGSCSKFTCDCREWVAPVAAPAKRPG